MRSRASVVLASENLLWLITPRPNGAKLRSVWDGFMPRSRRGYGAQPRVSTLGTIQPKRLALNGRKITWAKEKHLATWDTLPVPGSPTLRHRPRWGKQSQKLELSPSASRL